MSSEITVNSKKMNKDAAEILEMINNIQLEKIDLIAKLKNLHNSWQGKASSTFEAEIMKDIALIDDLLQALATYAVNISEGAEKYVSYANIISERIGFMAI